MDRDVNQQPLIDDESNEFVDEILGSDEMGNDIVDMVQVRRPHTIVAQTNEQAEKQNFQDLMTFDQLLELHYRNEKAKEQKKNVALAVEAEQRKQMAENDSYSKIVDVRLNVDEMLDGAATRVQGILIGLKSIC